MSDLISRQAAIEALQKEINKGIPPFDDVMGSIRCGVRLARNIIEDLPSAQPEQRWIPCSERQPDKGDDYLVTLWDDGRTWAEIALWNETFGGRWQAVLYNDVDYSDISNVIAWMPLPEPYRPEGSRDENKT